MELTRIEKIMKYTALAYAACFIGAAIDFIFLPGRMFGVMNALSQAAWSSLPPAADGGKFWLSLTVSMMATITLLSLYIYRDVKRYYEMAVPLCAAKFTSSAFGLGFFILGFVYPETLWNTLANLVIFLADFPLGVLMLVLYRKVKSQG